MSKPRNKVLGLAFLLILGALLIGSPSSVQCSTDICTKTGPGSPYDTCHGWHGDLLNACAQNYPNGGSAYQQCADNAWDAYVSCMGMFGCPVNN